MSYALVCASAVTLVVLPRLVEAADSPKVTITGGADESAHNYNWTVTNHAGSPIVYVEFPHYHADTFMAPRNWTMRTTYLVNVGVEDRPGVCAATAPPGGGILPGQAAEFGMRITAAGANVGKGEVTVKFSDGTETVVGGVSLPQPTPVNTQYMPLIGLAGIFILVVVVRELRRRRSPAGGEDASAGEEQNP